jgi:hypothetical protein
LHAIDGVISAGSTRVYLREGENGYHLPTELQLFKLGSAWALAASAHEVVSEHAPKVRLELQASGFTGDVTVAGYSNAVGHYIPTQRMFAAGGYESGVWLTYDRTGTGIWGDADFVSGYTKLRQGSFTDVRPISDILAGSRPTLESARFRSPVTFNAGTASETHTFFETEWVTAFYRDTSNQLRLARWNRGVWDAPIAAIGGTLASDPVVASYAADRHDIFYRRTDGLLGQTFWSSGAPWWSTFTHSAPQISSAPGAVSWGGVRAGNGRIDVVAVRADNGKLQHFWFDGSPSSTPWLTEEVPGSPTLVASQRLAIVSSRSGRIEIYVRDTDGALRFVALNKTGSSNVWEAWRNLSTGAQSDPVAVAYAPGETMAFVRASDGNLYARGVSVESGVFPSGSWLRFDGCGGSFGQAGTAVGNPTAASAAPGRIVLFARNAANQVCRWDLTGLSSGAPNLSGVAWEFQALATTAEADPVAVRSTRGTDLAFIHPIGGSRNLAFTHWMEGSIMHPFETSATVSCTFADERQCFWKPTN